MAFLLRFLFGFSSAASLLEYRILSSLVINLNLEIVNEFAASVAQVCYNFQLSVGPQLIP